MYFLQFFLLAFVLVVLVILPCMNCQLPEISLQNFYRLNSGDIRLGKSKYKDIDGNHYYFITFAPTADTLVSFEMLLEGGQWDEHFNMYFQHMWAQEMSRLNASRADPISLKVLDVGLNFGAFALFTASLKCEVWAFEMQPHIFTAVDMAMRLSGYRNDSKFIYFKTETSRVHMFNNAVYDRSDITVYFDSFKTNFGQTSVHHDNENSDVITTLRIEEVVKPLLSSSPSPVNNEEVLSPENEVFFMKMDIENSEPYALLGMQSLLLEGRIRHIAIEAITPLLLPIFYQIGYTCDIYDDFGGESGCYWPRNLGNDNCSFATYEGIENFYRKYVDSYGGMNPHCALPVEGDRTRRVNKNRTMKMLAWKYVNKFVRIKNESYLLSRSQTFDDRVYFLSEGLSFLMAGEDRAMVDVLVQLGRVQLEEISYADFFFNFLFDPKRNEFVSNLLQQAVSDQSAFRAVHSDLPQEDPLLQRKGLKSWNVSYFATMHAEVHVSFFTNTALVTRTTAFQFGRDDPYEYALEKCVAYGFTNRGAYQLERFAILVRFADRTVALKSGFEEDTIEGQGSHLDLDRCAQYMADKLTDYYCSKKASANKDYDDATVICKRREEQHTESDNSTLLAVLVYVGALWGTPAEIKLDLKSSSPESVAFTFCSSYLTWFITSFLKKYPVQWLQCRWDEGGGGEGALVNEQERLSCQRDFEAHVQRMIWFRNAKRIDKDVEFLHLRITDAMSTS